MRQPRPASIVRACAKIPVRALNGVLPRKYIEALEQNQLIASCCRHPENHEVEAFYSHPEEKAPDIYVFHCKCGKTHRRFCIGGGDERPFWDVV